MANSIGAEVGQKMRSAIKAKLLELNCYVDDELPDYIMVMVANKRTKTQMKEDLQLFLSTKTSVFVDWLHVVLKKLKEVTVTNPDVYKKPTKRKLEVPNIALKKEKKEKRKSKEADSTTRDVIEEFKSLTDNLPMSANKLAEQRKIVVMRDVDNFDIPLLSEVNMSTEEELEDIEQKIKTVKSRLGIQVESDDGEEDCIKLKPEPDELLIGEQRKVQVLELNPIPKKSERIPITFEKSNENIQNKRKSIHERLGKRKQSESHSSDEEYKKSRKEPKDKRKDNNILSRLGVLSKVSIPIKESKEEEEIEEPIKNREVASVVKIKPRIIPSDQPQANKNLLLRAVAEAQRSVAQVPKVGPNKPDALFTKKYKDKLQDKEKPIKKIFEEEKNLKKLIIPQYEESEYVPAPIRKYQEIPKYVPTVKSDDEQEQQFIVTLDGLSKPSIKSRLDKKKSPSPIIFDKVASPVVKAKLNVIPDKLPIVHQTTSLKNKERCKYWPNCRQNEKCEFVHPMTNCELFPHCKFGEKCLFLHPICKFGSSCTRRDCPYNHISNKGVTTNNVVKVAQQICKFFPNCTNLNCVFYHPKLCKFGKFCKNQGECKFSHSFNSGKSSLIWRSK